MQLVTFAPHFISTIVIVSILLQILSVQFGIVNNILDELGFEESHLWVIDYFKAIYAFSGYGSIQGMVLLFILRIIYY